MPYDLLNPAPVALRTALACRARDLLLHLSGMVRAWKNRREAMVMLATMDTHMLRDIGLGQGDVESALAEPLWSDPTLRLRFLALERRAAQRGRPRQVAPARAPREKIAC